MLFSYVAPEAMMPVAPVIAAGAGFFMMFGRGAVATGRRWVRRIFRRTPR